MKQKKLVIFLLAAVLPILACNVFSVQNASSRPITVRVSLPDGGNNIVRLSSQGGDSWFVLRGGAYSATAIPDEAYLERMKELQGDVLQMMATGESGSGFVNMLRETDPARAFNGMINLQADIDGELAGVSCSGTLLEPSGLEFITFLGTEGLDTTTVTFRWSDGTWSCG